MVIQFKVNESKLRQLSAAWVVSNSYNYVRAQFNFVSDDWKDKSKTAVFTFNGREYPVTLDRNDSCRVPWEVLMPPQFIVYVVGGSIDSEMIYTNSCPIDVHPSSSINYYDNASRNPSPDIYQQILDILQTKQDQLVVGDHISIDENDVISVNTEHFDEKFAEIEAMQVDNIAIDESTGEMWLVANGEQIGDKIVVAAGGVGVKSVQIDEEGNLIVSYSDGTSENVGKVTGSECVGIYIPALSEDGILTFELADKATEEKIELDIDKSNNWNEITGVESETTYIWQEI